MHFPGTLHLCECWRWQAPLGKNLACRLPVVSLRWHYLHPFHHLSIDVFIRSTSCTEKETLLKEVCFNSWQVSMRQKLLDVLIWTAIVSLPQNGPFPWQILNLPFSKQKGISGNESVVGKANKNNCVILSSKQLLAYSCLNIAHSLLLTLTWSGYLSSSRRKKWDP